MTPTSCFLGVARLARRAGVTSPNQRDAGDRVAVLWALVMRLPRAAYLLAIPMLFNALHAMVASGAGKPLVRAMTAAAVSLPLTLVWAPVPYFVLAGFRLSAAWASGVLLCASVFERARFAIDGRVVATLLTLAGAAAAVGIAGADASQGKPRPLVRLCARCERRPRLQGVGPQKHGRSTGQDVQRTPASESPPALPG